VDFPLKKNLEWQNYNSAPSLKKSYGGILHSTPLKKISSSKF
jgi:hypothetical protein